MMLNTVKKYESDSSESDEVGPLCSKSRRPPIKNVWLKKAEFESAEFAKEYVDSLGIWKKVTSYNGEIGYKVTYRCTAGTYRKNECPAGIYLLYHSDSLKVSLYENIYEHNNHTDGNRGLPKTTRKAVCQLFEDGIRKPNAIIAALQNRNIQEPNKVALSNFLAVLRKEKIVPSTISISELYNWCNSRINIPDDDDEPFVLGINIEDSDIDHKQDLKIVISTKRLLQLAIKSDGIQADTTYKLIWQGYPVLIVGTSDKNHVFHPIVIAVCGNEFESDFEYIFKCVKESSFKITNIEWNPTILLADASNAITSGFKSVFGSPVRRLMCYFHVIKNIESKLRLIKNEKIRNDIETLHLCPNDEIFNVVSELFLKKWIENDNENIRNFIEYFKSMWLNTNRYWYEGACDSFPSTNNSLETMNIILKKQHTFRERLPVGQFLTFLEKIVKSWSNERDLKKVNCKIFNIRPENTTKIWTDAYQWAKLDINIYEKKNRNESLFYFTSDETEKITHEMVQMYENMHLKWNTFDEYSNQNRIWKVIVSYENSILSTCICPIYLKKYVCKHSLGVLIRLGKEKVPNVVKNLSLGQKRKRGRPSKSKKALLVQ